MRYIGLDIGTKRIGISVSDPLNITAQGIMSYNVTEDMDKDLEYIIDLSKQYEPYTFIVGLPRNMNGTYGPMCDKIKEIGALLGEKSGKEIKYWDERLTTVSAHKMLISADVSRKKRKKVVDKIAASFILQSFIDSL